MIDEIKIIVQNYLNNAKLTTLMLGTVVADGIKVSDRLTVPLELIKGNMKKYISNGDKVKLIRNHGGQEYYIVEIIDKSFILSGIVTSAGVIVNNDLISNEKIVGNLKAKVTLGDRVRLLRDLGNDKFYILEVII